jgi:Arabinose efflux permease
MRRSRNVRILILISFLQGLVFYAPVATLYRRAHHLPIGDLFLIESISWVLTFLLEAPWGRFADRFGYRLTLISGNVVYALSKLVFAGAEGFPGFLEERILLSIAIAAISGCDTALMYRSSRDGEAERNFGYRSAAGTAGLVIASLASSLLYDSTYRMTAVATIPPYALAAILSFFLSDEGGRARPSAPPLLPAFRALLADRRLLVFLFATALMEEVSHSLTVFLGQLQYERSGIPECLYGAIYAALQLVPLVSGAAGALGRRFDRRAIMLICIGAELLSLLVLLVSPNAIAAPLCLAAMSASSALYDPFAASLQNERASDSARATTLSVNAMAIELVAALANLAIGRAADHSLTSSYALCAVFMVAVLASSALWLPLAEKAQ